MMQAALPRKTNAADPLQGPRGSSQITLINLECSKSPGEVFRNGALYVETRNPSFVLLSFFPVDTAAATSPTIRPLKPSRGLC